MIISLKIKTEFGDMNFIPRRVSQNECVKIHGFPVHHHQIIRTSQGAGEGARVEGE